MDTKQYKYTIQEELERMIPHVIHRCVKSEIYTGTSFTITRPELYSHLKDHQSEIEKMFSDACKIPIKLQFGKSIDSACSTCLHKNNTPNCQHINTCITMITPRIEEISFIELIENHGLWSENLKHDFVAYWKRHDTGKTLEEFLGLSALTDERDKNYWYKELSSVLKGEN